MTGKTTHELVQIAMAGGGMTLSARGMSVFDLQQIATASSNKGARLVIRDPGGMTTPELVQIAMAGKGCVSFEF